MNKSLASTGCPPDYRIAYSFGLDRWRVILPDERTHWLAPGADKHAARSWANRHVRGLTSTICSSPGINPLNRPKPVDDAETDALLARIRDEAQS